MLAIIFKILLSGSLKTDFKKNLFRNFEEFYVEFSKKVCIKDVNIITKLAIFIYKNI